MPFIGKQSTSNSQITNYTTTVGSGGQSNFTVVIEGGDETHVYLNGVLLKETTDYTVSSTQVSLVSAAVENDIVEIKVFRSFALADAVRATGGSFTGDVTVPNLTLSSGAIKSSNGTSGITIASDGQITVNQNNPTLTLGSNVSGFTGIKVLDTWELTSGFTGTADPIQNNIQRQTDAKTAYIGSAMTEVDGIFTFPMTGKYMLKFHLNHALNGSSRYVGSGISSVISGSSSIIAYNYVHLVSSSAQTKYTNNHIEALFDVTDVSTHKVKFSVVEDINTGTSTNAGTSLGKFTYMQFIRIGD